MINGFCRMWQNPFAISPLELVLPGVPCYFPRGGTKYFVGNPANCRIFL